jgi:hypothetical protein
LYNFFVIQVPNYKRLICKAFEETGKCEWDKTCMFAHGSSELRSPFLISRISVVERKFFKWFLIILQPVYGSFYHKLWFFIIFFFSLDAIRR